MAKGHSEAKEYFSYCITPTKTATPIFEQLLLGIYGYITKHVAPWDINYLTPAKLAQFYRLVGGDFDRLFLESPPASLSFVYSSLGCQHTLHQEKNLFEPPTIPALTAQGFIRWQVIQILLAPQEHVPFLQEAVKRFEIHNAGPGGPFPKVLPAECLPSVPDHEMIKWHEGVSRRLREECEPRPRSRSKSKSSRVDVEAARANFANEANPLSPRRRPHLHSPHSSDSRRHSSSDAREERYPNSPHPLRNSRRQPRASVESVSSISSGAESPGGRPPPKIRTPQRSPRSYSVARNPYSPPATSPGRDAMGRRHSSHGIEPQQVARDSLSPQFFAPNGRSRPGNGPSPVSMGPPPSSGKSPTGPAPPSHVRGHRNTVSHDRSKDHSWREKLTSYVGLSSDNGGRRRNNSESRESRFVDRDLEADRRHVEGLKAAERPGILPDPRRQSPGIDSDYQYEWRRARERRSSGEDLSSERFHNKP